MCHRPERLADLMCALRGSGLEPQTDAGRWPMGRSIPLLCSDGRGCAGGGPVCGSNREGRRCSQLEC
ncbi:MAG: hypothetical protein V8S86_05610 [Eubacteriales bacterium]